MLSPVGELVQRTASRPRCFRPVGAAVVARQLPESGPRLGGAPSGAPKGASLARSIANGTRSGISERCRVPWRPAAGSFLASSARWPTRFTTP
jgi:hypothetical protein